MFLKIRVLIAVLGSVVSFSAFAGHPGVEEELYSSSSTSYKSMTEHNSSVEKAAYQPAVSKQVKKIQAMDDDVAKKAKQQEIRDAKMIENTLLPEHLKKLPRVKPNTWVVNKGEKLSAVINRWSKIEGWTPVWNAELDLIMAASSELKGTFKESVTELFKTLEQNTIAINGAYYIIDLYKANDVARISMLNANQATTMK